MHARTDGGRDGGMDGWMRHTDFLSFIGFVHNLCMGICRVLLELHKGLGCRVPISGLGLIDRGLRIQF